MGANRRNMYLVSRRFAPAYVLWGNENIRDQYWILIKAYQTSKKTLNTDRNKSLHQWKS